MSYGSFVADSIADRERMARERREQGAATGRKIAGAAAWCERELPALFAEHGGLVVGAALGAQYAGRLSAGHVAERLGVRRAA